MITFSVALRYFLLGEKIAHKDWKNDYFIFRCENTIIDSMGNLFYPDLDEFISITKIIYEAGGKVWNVYEEN